MQVKGKMIESGLRTARRENASGTTYDRSRISFRKVEQSSDMEKMISDSELGWAWTRFMDLKEEQ